MICQYGVFDYECQIQNSCYLNLAYLGLILVALVAILYGLCWLLAFLCRHASKLQVILQPLVQAICCVNGWCGRANCDFLRKRVAKNITKKQQEHLEDMKKKMKKMNLNVDIDSLSESKRKEIMMIINQYQLVEDDV